MATYVMSDIHGEGRRFYTMLDKIGFVADYEGRSVNSHILILIRQNIRAFEAEHGPIDGNIRPDVNVKPSRK